MGRDTERHAREKRNRTFLGRTEVRKRGCFLGEDDCLHRDRVRATTVGSNRLRPLMIDQSENKKRERERDQEQSRKAF